MLRSNLAAKLAFVVPVGLGLGLGATAATAGSASAASVTAGADLALVVPRGEPETNLGWLVLPRIGLLVPVGPLVEITPEVGGGYGQFTPVGSATKAIGIGYLGARASIDAIVLRPYVTARIGYGVASTTNLPNPDTRKSFASGMYLHAEAGLIKRFGPVDVGLGGGFSTIEPGGCFCARWIQIDAHGTYRF